MSTGSVPILNTARLTLRGWKETDLDAYAAMAADADVMRYIGGALDRAQSWRQIALHVGHWSLRGYGNWAIERTADGVLLGRCGLWRPEGWPGLEIGWKLARHAWGQRYATEAARAAMSWAWTTLDAPRLISVIHPENGASIRVAERLGLHPARDDVINGQPVVIFDIARQGHSR